MRDLLEEGNWTQAQLAQQLGFSQEFLARLIAGEVVLTEALAGCLQQVLGGSVAFWLAREAQYRTACKTSTAGSKRRMARQARKT